MSNLQPSAVRHSSLELLKAGFPNFAADLLFTLCLPAYTPQGIRRLNHTGVLAGSVWVHQPDPGTPRHLLRAHHGRLRRRAGATRCSVRVQGSGFQGLGTDTSEQTPGHLLRTHHGCLHRNAEAARCTL